MRRMSFALTMPAILDRTKTVTRRVGWRFLKVGDRVAAVAKTMGFRKGEKAPAPVAVIEVVDVRREPLNSLLIPGYGASEMRAEGVSVSPATFIVRFAGKWHPSMQVTRIEFRYIEDESRGG